MNINKKLTGNILSLFTLKGVEYLVSFITLPYLLRVLGPDKYGAIVFANVIINYGRLVVDYGFNITAPRDIAKADDSVLDEEFASIFCAKFMLFIPLIIIGSLLVYFFRDMLDMLLIFCVLPSLIGNMIFPIWYYQGIQKMKFITLFNLVARLISVVCIFALVNEQSDYLMAALLQSVTPIIAGIISLVTLYRLRPTLLRIPKLKRVIVKVKDGWDIFISTLFINLYTNSNIFILGIMTNDTVVGYYSAANKLIEALKGAYSPISTAIFPHVSSLVKESRERAILFLRKAVRIMGGFSLIISLITLIFADPIVDIIMGDKYADSVVILRMISFLPFIIALSNIFGIQTMVAFGMQRTFSKVLMWSAVVNFVIIFPLVYFFEAMGLAVTMVIVELFVTIAMYIVLIRNNIKLFTIEKSLL